MMPNRLTGELNDVARGGAPSKLYLSYDFESEKVKSSMFFQSIGGETVYAPGIENNDVGQVLAYAISYIYGFTSEESLDVDAFVKCLYHFCMENGLSGNISGCNNEISGRNYNIAIKIDKNLLDKIYSQYFLMIKGFQKQYKVLDVIGNVRAFSDATRIADTSPIIAMKCILASRGLPYSQIGYEMLVPEDIDGITKAFGEFYDARQMIYKEGLNANEITLLRTFAKKLGDGAYSTGYPAVIRVRGKRKSYML